MTKIEQVMHTLHHGDAISDEDIEFAIKTLTPVVNVLHELGPVYKLAWKELYFDLDKFITFQKARKEKYY